MYEHIFIYYTDYDISMNHQNQLPTALTDEQFNQLAEFFRVLGDPSRVKIIAALLDKTMNVQSLAERAGISPSAVSHHLRSLRQMRLARPQKQGRQVFYTLDDQHVADLYQRAADHIRHS